MASWKDRPRTWTWPRIPGEKGTVITFWRSPDKERDGEEARPVLRFYKVWNYDQVTGMPPCPIKEPGVDLHPKELAERIIKSMPLPPSITKVGDEAYYSIVEDRVNVPTLKKFKDLHRYYSVYFHELVHSTRHSKRLARTYRNEKPDAPRVFGSCDYSREELVAELGAAFLCAECGIENTVEQSSAYIAGWMSAIAEDEKLHGSCCRRRTAGR